MKCPSCDVTITAFNTVRADSNGSGMAPRAIVVWAITCTQCRAVLGVIPATD